jgi:hypothetical protein
LRESRQRWHLWKLFLRQRLHGDAEQGAKTAFRQDLIGGFGANNQCAADLAVFVSHRVVAVGPVNLHQLTVPVDWNQLVDVSGGFALTHYGFDLRTDERPNFGPAFTAPLADSRGMFV